MADLILSVGGDTRLLDAALARSLNRPRSLGNLNVASIEQPLGRITGSASEFNKSLAASNARVIAFGASAGAIFAVRAGFDKLVSSTIEVENTLTEINTLLGLSSKQLGAFGVGLLTAANTAGVSFANASKAAQEFARQGLSAEETIKRTSDALTLARLSGVDFGEAVSSLTAIVNSFKNEALTTTEVVERLAEVDAKFAITASGIAEALKRVGSSAEDANVTLNQTIALITAAQQVTGRGEAIIGNAFKTIFTRVQRPQVLADLESIGVLTRNAAGDILPVVDILKNLAETYETLSSSEKSFVSENVASVYQINTLKAVLGDLGSGFSFYNQALRTAETSTGSANQRLLELNETLSSKLTKSLNSITVAAAGVGNLTLGKGIGGVLDYINRNSGKVAEFLNPKEGLEKSLGSLSFGEKGEEIGGRLVRGVLKGFGDILAGPGAQVIFILIFKLFERLAKFAAEAIGELGEIGKKKQALKAIEKESLDYLKQNPQVLAQIRAGTKTVADVHNEIIDRIRIQNTLLKYQFDQAQAIARISYASGITAKPASSARRSSFATGYVPNYDAEMMEKSGALAGGYQPGMIKHMQIAGLGDVIYNSAETVTHLPGADKPYISPPENSNAGRAHREESLSKNGIDPYRDFAAKGMVPNFAENIRRGAIYNLGTKQVRVLEQVGENWKVKHHDLFEKVVPAEQLSLANIAQVKSYMRWRDAKGRYMAGGFVPSLAVNKFQTAPKAQPIIPEATQIAMVEKMVAKVRAAGPREDTTLDRRAYPEGRPTYVGLSAAESGSLYQNGVTRDKIDAARALFGQEPYTQKVENRVERVANTINKMKVKQAKNTTDDVTYNGLDRFTMFSDRISGNQTGQVNAGSGRDLDKGTFTASFRAAKLKDKFPFKSVLEPKISKAYFDAYQEIGFEKFGIFKADTFADTLHNVNDQYGVLFGGLFDSMIRHSIQGSSGVRNKDALGQGSSRFDVKRPIPLLNQLFDLEGAYEMGDFKFGGIGDNAKSMAKKIQSQWAEEHVSGVVDPRVTRVAGTKRSESDKAAEKASMEEAIKKFGGTPAAVAAYGLVPNLASSETIQRIFNAAKKLPNGAAIISKLNEGTGIPDEKFIMAAGKLGVKTGAQAAPKVNIDEFFANASANFKAQEERENRIRSIPLSENEIKNINFVQGLFKQKFGNLADTKEGNVGKTLVELRDAAFKGKDYINFGKGHDEFLENFEKNYVNGSRKKYVHSSLFGIDSDVEDQVTKKNDRRNSMYEKHLYKRFSKYKARGRFAGGLVPNLAELDGAVHDAINREMDAGYSRSQVKVGYDSRLKDSGGLGVYNTTEGSLSNAVNLHMAMGKTIGQVQDSGKGAARGMVPNLAFEEYDSVTGLSNIANQLGLAFASWTNQGDRAIGMMDKMANKWPSFFSPLGSALGFLGVRMKETAEISKQKIAVEEKGKQLSEKQEASEEGKSLRRHQNTLEKSQEKVANAKASQERAIAARERVNRVLGITDPTARANEIKDINTNKLRLQEKAELNLTRGKTSRAEIKESDLVSILRKANTEDAAAQKVITQSSVTGSNATISRDNAQARFDKKFKRDESSLSKERAELERSTKAAETRRELQNRTRASISSGALKGSLAISGGGAILSETIFGSGRSQAKAAMEGFTSGLSTAAQVLTAFPGPIGIGIASVITLASAVKSLDTYLNEYSEALIAAADAEKSRTQRINSSVDGYIQSLSSLQQAYSGSSASAETISKLQKNLAKEYSNLRLAGVGSDKLTAFATASSDEEKLRVAGEIKGEQNRKQDDKNFAASFAVDAEKKIGQTGAFGLGRYFRTLQGISNDSLVARTFGVGGPGERVDAEENKFLLDKEGKGFLDLGRKNLFDEKFADKGGGKKFLEKTTGDILGGFTDDKLESLTKRLSKGNVTDLSTLTTLFGEENQRLSAANKVVDSQEGRNQLALSIQKEVLLRKIEADALKELTTKRAGDIEANRLTQSTLEGLRRRTLALNTALLALSTSGLDNFVFGNKIGNKAQEGAFAEQSLRGRGYLERDALFTSEKTRAIRSSSQTSSEISNNGKVAFADLKQQGFEAIQKVIVDALPQVKRDSATGNITGGSASEREGAKFVADATKTLLSRGQGLGDPIEFQKQLNNLIDGGNIGAGAKRAAKSQVAQVNSADLVKASLDSQRNIAQKGLEQAQALSQEAVKMNEQLKLIAEQSKINFGGGIKNFLDKKEGRSLDRDIRRGLRQSNSGDPIRAGRGSLELGIALQKFTGGTLDKSAFSAFSSKAKEGVEADTKRRINGLISGLEREKGGASPGRRKDIESTIKNLKGVDVKAIASAQVDEALKLNDTQAQLQSLKSIDNRMAELVKSLATQGIKVNWNSIPQTGGNNVNEVAADMSKRFSSSIVPMTQGINTSISKFTESMDKKIGDFLKANEKSAESTEKEVKAQQKALQDFLSLAEKNETERHSRVLTSIDDMLKKLNKPIEEFATGLKSVKPNSAGVQNPPQ